MLNRLAEHMTHSETQRPLIGQFRDYDGSIKPLDQLTTLFRGRRLDDEGNVVFKLARRGATIRLVCGEEFGTGGHPSTIMTLEILKSIYRRKIFKSVLDFGCGTGILGISCSVLGARHITFVDKKPSAARIAMRNARSNVGRSSFSCCVLRNSSQIPNGSFELIVANLPASSQLRNLEGFARGMRAGGVLLLSGLKREAGAGIVAKARQMGMGLVSAHELGRWAAYLFSDSGRSSLVRPFRHSFGSMTSARTSTLPSVRRLWSSAEVVIPFTFKPVCSASRQPR